MRSTSLYRSQHPLPPRACARALSSPSSSSPGIYVTPPLSPPPLLRCPQSLPPRRPRAHCPHQALQAPRPLCPTSFHRSPPRTNHASLYSFLRPSPRLCSFVALEASLRARHEPVVLAKLCKPLVLHAQHPSIEAPCVQTMHDSVPSSTPIPASTPSSPSKPPCAPATSLSSSPSSQRPSIEASRAQTMHDSVPSSAPHLASTPSSPSKPPSTPTTSPSSRDKVIPAEKSSSTSSSAPSSICGFNTRSDRYFQIV